VSLSPSADFAQFTHDEISRLENRIDELAARIDRCRRIVFVAKIVIAAGGVVLLALMVGAVRFNPVMMIGGITAVIGGIVALGSNMTTAQQASAEMKAAEALRAELIGRMELRLVGSPEA
jgi:hypothetical protein